MDPLVKPEDDAVGFPHSIDPLVSIASSQTFRAFRG